MDTKCLFAKRFDTWSVYLYTPKVQEFIRKTLKVRVLNCVLKGIKTDLKHISEFNSNDNEDASL